MDLNPDNTIERKQEVRPTPTNLWQAQERTLASSLKVSSWRYKHIHLSQIRSLLRLSRCYKDHSGMSR